MGYLSKEASAAINATSSATGGYLSPSKLSGKDKESMRFAILSPEPLEHYTVWGECDGQKKPFRFPYEPSPSDIKAELGDFEQRDKYDGSGKEAPKFGISLFVFDYASEEVKVLELGQRGLIRELDKISQEEGYEDLHAWDFTISREGVGLKTEYSLLPSPRRKGFDEKIAEVWKAAEADGYDIKRLIGGGNPFSAG